MAGTNKIIKLGLQKIVEDMLANGITTSTAIAAALNAQGYSVSQPTVSRYFKEEKEARKAKTQQIVEDHVRTKVPADLDALEKMEAQCLEWASENNDAFACRQANQYIEAAARQWIDLILRLDGDDRQKAVRLIIQQCMAWTADDIKLQAARIAAMRQASSIIEMKLRFTMGENRDGGIFFLDSDRGDQLVKNNDGRLMVIPGGNG